MLLCGGGLNRVDLSFCVFPCFAVFGCPKYPDAGENAHLQCYCPQAPERVSEVRRGSEGVDREGRSGSRIETLFACTEADFKNMPHV